MLDSLRNAARSWVAKLLLMLLVLSFGIWGISADLVGGGGNAVVTVGDQQVSVEEFRLTYQRQIGDLSRRFGTQLTAEQARAFGIQNAVIAQLSAGAALDQLAENMNLGLSQDKLAQLIGEDPAFKAANGQFDRDVFTARLRNAGIQEDDYIQERSKVAVRSQIVDAVSDGFTPPQVLVDALKRYRDESRTIDYLVLSNANIAPVKAPADDVLSEWFESAKTRYRAPEYRSFAYVKLQPADIADEASITDEEVRAEYEKRINGFKTPETRTIEQLPFPNKEMAQAAATQLKEGTTDFDQLVKDQGKAPSDVLLGDFTRQNMPDSAFTEPAFQVADGGGTTSVIDGTFGPVILRVSNIRPETTRSFEEVRDEIRKDLAISAASREVQDVHDRFEEMRNGGSTLEEAASELGLKVVSVTADASGRGEDEQQLADLPAADQLIGEVFRTDPGVYALPVHLGNNGYVWFETRNVVAERDRPLAEVREKAVADWTAEQQRQALAARAEELKARLDKGETLQTIAGELGLAVETKQGLRRGGSDATFSSEAITTAFSGPVGTTGSALGGDGETRLLMKVTGVDAGSTDVLSEDPQLTRMAEAAGDDMLDQMVNSLKSTYGVSVNQNVVNQITLQ